MQPRCAGYSDLNAFTSLQQCSIGAEIAAIVVESLENSRDRNL